MIAECWFVAKDEGPEAGAKYHKEHCIPEALEQERQVWKVLREAGERLDREAEKILKGGDIL